MENQENNSVKSLGFGMQIILLEKDTSTEINWYAVTLEGETGNTYGYAYNTNQLLDDEGYPYESKSYIEDGIQTNIEYMIDNDYETFGLE